MIPYVDWMIAHPEKVGLALDIAGTLLIALAIGRSRGDAFFFDQKGRRQRLAVILHPWWFGLGLTLIAAGFVLQLLG